MSEWQLCATLIWLCFYIILLHLQSEYIGLTIYDLILEEDHEGIRKKISEAEAKSLTRTTKLGKEPNVYIHWHMYLDPHPPTSKHTSQVMCIITIVWSVCMCILFRYYGTYVFTCCIQLKHASRRMVLWLKLLTISLRLISTILFPIWQ